MLAQLINLIKIALQVLSYSYNLIIWNLFLAFIPLILSIFLFRVWQKRTFFWWLGFGVFLAFLPNAPYVLTDIIHLIDLIREGYPIWIVMFVLIPQYSIFVLAGFQAYTISLINLGYSLNKQGLGEYIIGVELLIHALCSLGIYLGRFQRFNSWDFVTKPHAVSRSIVENFTNHQPVLAMGITFIFLIILYWLMKQVNLGIALRMQTFEKAEGKPYT